MYFQMRGLEKENYASFNTICYICMYLCMFVSMYVHIYVSRKVISPFSQRNLCAVVVYDIRSYTTFSAPSELFSSA